MTPIRIAALKAGDRIVEIEMGHESHMLVLSDPRVDRHNKTMHTVKVQWKNNVVGEISESASFQYNLQLISRGS